MLTEAPKLEVPRVTGVWFQFKLKSLRGVLRAFTSSPEMLRLKRSEKPPLKRYLTE